MKILAIIFLSLVLLSASCNKPIGLSLNNPQQVFGLVPLDSFSKAETDSIINELSVFYNTPVVLLQQKSIPGNFFNKVIQQYSGDSILMLLSKLQNDTLTEIIGLTHQPIFTMIEAKPIAYYDKNLLGFSYQPGNACIISDIKFRTGNHTFYTHRMRNVIIHEIGHNLGLPHCADDKCIMSKKNGDMMTLDKSGNDYCNSCRKKLTKP
ncbi:matrixin family metalloprotease [Ferruginibacter sp. SUN106]|uniref:matrixin family metalloprotease n=1 Tax=Ferruginibacter sp. SUN106 TaxID=2978348 RepID=UPI003D36A83E